MVRNLVLAQLDSPSHLGMSGSGLGALSLDKLSVRQGLSRIPSLKKGMG